MRLIRGPERIKIPMSSFSKQEIIFITGKGGVGKSAVAAGFALKRAQSGKKTLLVELGHQSFYQDYFNLASVTYKPQTLKPNLDLSLWSGKECLREYLIYLLKVESIYKLFFENPVSKTLIQIAPALPELSIIGKITSGPRKVGPPLNYDTIVVDGFATGHFLALLNAPRGMAESFKFGPMGEQSKSIEKVISDPEMAKYYVVSFPEEMPVVEAEELAHEIEKIVHIKPMHLFNRFVEISAAAKAEKVPATEKNLQEFQQHMQYRSERQDALLLNLQKSKSPVQVLPQVFESDPWTVVQSIAEAL